MSQSFFSDIIPVLGVIHFAALSSVCLYGLHRIWLIYCLYKKKKNKTTIPAPFTAPEEFPVVTVQLPFYNERFVAQRLLDAAARLDWPRDRLDIQVLDDSDDDTRQLVDARAAWWREQGVNGGN